MKSTPAVEGLVTFVDLVVAVHCEPASLSMSTALVIIQVTDKWLSLRINILIYHKKTALAHAGFNWNCYSIVNTLLLNPK